MWSVISFVGGYLVCCGLVFWYSWMYYPREKPFKMGDKVLFESWDHEWVVGSVTQLGPRDHIRIVYRSPIDGKLDAENTSIGCPRIQHLPT